MSHKERFGELFLRKGMPEDLRHNIEYTSCFYILSATQELYDKSKNFIDDEGIDFYAMRARQDFSSGYNIILDLAQNIFNGRCDANPVDICTRLDNNLFSIAIRAMQMRHGCQDGDLFV